MQVGATCKHFAAYSLENADGYSRLSFNASVSQRQASDPYTTCLVSTLPRLPRLTAFVACKQHVKVLPSMVVHDKSHCTHTHATCIPGLNAVASADDESNFFTNAPAQDILHAQSIASWHICAQLVQPRSKLITNNSNTNTGNSSNSHNNKANKLNVNMVHVTKGCS